MQSFTFRSKVAALIIVSMFIGKESICQDNTFNCSSDLYQVVDGAILKKLDPATGSYNTIGTSSIKYNGAGYNVEDNYIYGIGEGTTLVRVNNLGETTNLGTVQGFSALSYSGDLDTAGNWYSFKKTSGAWLLNKIDVDVQPPIAIVADVTELYGVASAGSCADISYNPVSKMFYGMSGGKLTEFDPFNYTVKVIQNYEHELPAGAYGAVWSDVDGNTYFFNNATGNIYRASFNTQGQVTSFGFVAVSTPNGSNDGMSCTYAAPVQFPEICDNGLDDDGDGLVDCDDPDCTANSHCEPTLAIELGSISQTCYNSIVPYYIRVINDGYLDISGINIEASLPEGFMFDSDTLDLGSQSIFTQANRPSEGALNSLNWSSFSLKKQDTLIINFSAITTGSISDGTYAYDLQVQSDQLDDITKTKQISVDRSLCENPSVFQCVPAFYQVYKKRGEPNVFGRLNPKTGDYTKISLMDYQANGLGYDVISNMTYGASGKKFIQLSDDGAVTYMGINFDKKCYVGDMDMSGFWFGKVGSDIVKIDVSIPEIVATYENQGMPGWDMAYNLDGNFYAIHSNQLYQFNPLTQLKTTVGSIIGTNIPHSGFGAQWTGSDGFLYASNNNTGEIFKIDVQTAEAQLVMMATAGLRFNDGFSCPTELPAVFDFEYSDYSEFGLASNLIHTQDLGDDNVPDFDGVWLGSQVSFDLSDPSNSDATGDLYDDGLTFPTNLRKGEEYTVQIGLNTHKTQKDIYWAMWIDWDDDQTPESFYNGMENSQGAVSITPTIGVPTDQKSGPVAVRVRVSELPLESDDITSQLVGVGEVEDYVFNITIRELQCGNGVDDDGDGLIDCDDPDCAAAQNCSTTTTTTGGEGGLESNDRLASKIALTQFNRSKKGKTDFNDKTQMPRLLRDNHYGAVTSRSNARGGFNLQQMIPIDIIPNSETFISSPEHLLDITNASEVFAVDIFIESQRVGAILALTSEQGVYEHTKYVCDRLNGSKILDILSYKIDGVNDYLIAKMQLANGSIEYATSISLRVDENNTFSMESFWNLDFYTKKTDFFNFQVWANNTEKLFTLVNEVKHLAELQSPISSFKMGSPPEVFVNAAEIKSGKLNIELSNRNNISSIETSGHISQSETEESEYFFKEINLNESASEEISIEVGNVYDLGITLQHSNSKMPDVVFLADGAWGTDYGLQEEVHDYVVKPNHHSEEGPFWVERNISIQGRVKSSVAVFRAFSPSFRSIDLNHHNKFTFEGSGTGKVEVTLVKSSIQHWEDQPRVIITLTDNTKTYSFGHQAFQSTTEAPSSWDDLTMVVFDVKGNTTSLETFSMNISNVNFNEAVISSVDSQLLKNPVLAYPNPARDVLNIDFQSNKNGDFTVELFDTSGKLVLTNSGTAIAGSNTTVLTSLQDYQGIYFYKINIGESQQHRGKIFLNN